MRSVFNAVTWVLVAVPLAMLMIVLKILKRITIFQLTEFEKERIMHDLSHTDAPQELVNSVDATLEAIAPSRNHRRIHFFRKLEFCYDSTDTTQMLTLLYYKDERLKWISVRNTNRTTRRVASFEQDGFLSSMRVERKRPRICPRQ